MLKLQHGNKSFEFNVVGYQFPKSTDYDDANWLTISVSVSDDDNSWNAIDNCLSTTELQELRHWLFSVRAKGTENSSISFLEGELEFEYCSHNNELVVILDFNFHPKGDKYDYAGGEEEYKVVFDMSEKSIATTLAGLDSLIDKCPEKLKSKK